MTRLMGTILRLIARSCSSRRVSVNRIGRSLSRHSCLISCVCSTNMSMTCTRAGTESQSWQTCIGQTCIELGSGRHVFGPHDEGFKTPHEGDQVKSGNISGAYQCFAMVEVAHYGHIPHKLRIGHEPRQKLIAVMGRQRGFFQNLQLFLFYGCNNGYLSMSRGRC